jgi:hypothetical protein
MILFKAFCNPPIKHSLQNKTNGISSPFVKLNCQQFARKFENKRPQSFHLSAAILHWPEPTVITVVLPTVVEPANVKVLSARLNS